MYDKSMKRDLHNGYHRTGSNNRCTQLCKKYSTGFFYVCYIVFESAWSQTSLLFKFQTIIWERKIKPDVTPSARCNGKGNIWVCDASRRKAWSYHNNFDNLVGYTCINVQVNEQTRKIGCIINISKNNNVQTLFKRPKFVHLCHGLALENDVRSCFICYRG